MRRFIAIILLPVYLLATGGLSVVQHYCGGTLTHTSLVSESDCCCSDDCCSTTNEDAQLPNDDCCNNDIKYLKLPTDQAEKHSTNASKLSVNDKLSTTAEEFVYSSHLSVNTTAESQATTGDSKSKQIVAKKYIFFRCLKIDAC